MSASWEVQKAIYTSLSSDSTFMNLINSRLYDEPPTNSAYPYVVIGDCVEIPDNRLLRNGYDVSAMITIFTKPQGLGFKTAKEILEAINNVLNMKKPALDTLNIVICRFDNMYTDRDGDKRVITARYQVIAHDDDNITF